MSFAGSINNFYKKYKKPLSILVLLFFIYKLFNYYYNVYEGYDTLSHPQCSTYNNCSDCVKNYNSGDNNVPCWWNKSKGCSAFYDEGYSRSCTTPSPAPSTCEMNTNCKDCVGNSNNCFWGDRDQKCSSTSKSGYGKICSGSDPEPNCPKCDECPKLTLLKTPTFITQQ